MVHATHPKYRADIDGLRAIAVLSVVGFHAFPGWVRGGFVGVDIFFVISGFLISTIIIGNLQNDTFSFLDFYSRRIRRIFPALIVVLIACVAVGWYVLLPDEYKQLGKHVFSGAGFVSNLLLWSESGYFDNSADTKPLLHLWSLGVEEQFYLLWPLVVWLAWLKKFNTAKVIFLTLVVSFAWNIYGIYRNPVATFYSPQTRFWELSCGSLLAWFSIQSRTAVESVSRAHRNVLSAAGHLLIVLSLLLTTEHSLFPGWWAILPVLGAVLIILAGADAWLNRRFLAARWMVWIGLISFPLYLWHWPLLSFAHILEDQSPTRLIRSLAVFSAIVLAWMTYRFVEKPIRHHRGQRHNVIVLSALMTTLGIFGVYAYANDGFSFRTGKSAQGALYEEFKKNDWSKTWSSTGCSVEYLKISPDCNANSPNPEMLLLGDSHSQGLYRAISEVKDATGKSAVRVMRLGTYLPLLDTAITLKPGVRYGGEETNRELDFAIHSASVKVVVISFRGVVNLTSKDFQGGHEIDIPGRHFDFREKSNALDRRSTFEMALRETIAKLATSNKQIVFVVDNPELGFHPKECVDMRRFHFASWVPRSPCAVSREAFDLRNQDYRSIVFSVARAFPSMKVFDTVEDLCDSTWCDARRQGQFLYQDDNHLSVFGSELIARRLLKSTGTQFD